MPGGAPGTSQTGTPTKRTDHHAGVADEVPSPQGPPVVSTGVEGGDCRLWATPQLERPYREPHLDGSIKSRPRIRHKFRVKTLIVLPTAF